jgi:hypothetical protein
MSLRTRIADMVKGGHPDTGHGDMPAWVSRFATVSPPLVAVIVMVMCAPGEHHLAIMAGWSDRLAWGMPGCLVVYCGLAAVMATKRDRGAPGKRTAVAGAVLSLLLAMSAQPVSHLFVTRKWTGDPWILIVVVSCVPPLVLGHLLHLSVGDRASRVPVSVPVPVPSGVQSPVPVSRPAAPVVRPPAPASVSLSKASRPGVPSAPSVQPVRGPRKLSAGSVPSLVREARAQDPSMSRADITAYVRAVLPDAKADTIRKAIDRAA